MRSIFSTTKFGFIACVSAVALAQSVSAQVASGGSAAPAAEEATGLDDIVVTAQRREQNMQKVPVAVSAFSEVALETRQLNNLLDIANTTSGLQVSNRNGVILPFLRGVGSTGTSVGTEASVTVYLDGVYFARLPGAFFALNNLSRVEVLKGPQGTLFGRNASGGVIQLVTKDPSYDTEFKGMLSYGNLETYEGSVYASTGLTDKVAMDIAATGRKQKKGFGRNIVTGNKFVYDDHWLVTSKLLIEPSDTTKITINGFAGNSRVSTIRNAFPGTTSGYATNPRLPIPSTSRGFYDDGSDVDQNYLAKVWAAYVKIQQEIGFARFTSISGYSKIREHFDLDSDYTERPDSKPDLFTTTKQFTQEFQLSSLDKSDGLEWIVGAFYFNNLGRYDLTRFRGPAAPFGGGVDVYSHQRSKSLAGYGQITYEFVPKLSFTAGLRYTSDKVSADGIFFNPAGAVINDPPRASFTTKKWTFKTGLNYQATDDVLAYASFSRGFKEGNFPILFYNVRPSRPEILDAYEVGVKAELFDRRLRLNGAVFYYDLKDPQVQLIQLGALITENAEGAEVKGAELEMQAVLAEGLVVRANATYLDSTYTSFANAPSALPNPNPPFGTITPVGSINAKGNRTPYASKLTFGVGFDYTIRAPFGNVSLTGDYYHNSGFFFEPDNFLRQPSYDLFNGRIKYEVTENVGVSLWGKNLTNKKYISNATTNVGVSGYNYAPAFGRTYGVSVDFDF
ncbi:TonB-dependent receptor [Sphingomonadaceae bacterium G21617-S1]|nr:TonB-dependent receptor [Sphingomonadaceae bacterium G21617-S1]